MRIRSRGIAAIALTLIAAGVGLAQTRTDVFALTNAKIVTVSGATVEKGTIVIRDGLIESVGADAKVPADARVIDSSGLTVYPGIFDALQLAGVAPQQRGPGGATPGPTPTAPVGNSNYPAALQPGKSVIDELRGGDSQYESLRNAGFTTVLTVGREGIFNGQSAVINLAGESVSAMIVSDGFAQHFTFRTIPNAYPNSLLGTFSAFRQMILDAKRLQTQQKAYAADPRGLKRPESDRSLEALFPVVNRTMPIVFNANSENEIVRSLNLAKELNLRAIIAGGQEAWKVADRLKAENVPVLLSLNFPKRTAAASPDADPDSLEVLRLRVEVPKGPGILAQKGVKFAFQSGGASSADFFGNAAKATENGLSKEAAIRAMTLGSAEILGVGNRLGSIEAGKIANLTVIRGDILGKDRTVTHVFVDGRLFEQRPRPAAVNTTTVSNAVSAAGTWRVVIEVPDQELPATLTLTQDGTNVSGTLQSDAIGSSQIKNGKLDGDTLSFSTTVTFGGATFDIAFVGKISGNQISGTVEAPQGTVPFTGNRNPQE